MKGNYNKLKKKIDEMSRRLEEEEEIARLAESRRMSLMLEAEKEKERQYHRNFPITKIFRPRNTIDAVSCTPTSTIDAVSCTPTSTIDDIIDENK